MSIDSRKEKFKSKLRREKADDAHLSSSDEDSSSLFSKIVPEDFIFNGEEKSDKHNFLQPWPNFLKNRTSSSSTTPS